MVWGRYLLTVDSTSWNMDVGRFMLAFLLSMVWDQRKVIFELSCFCSMYELNDFWQCRMYKVMQESYHQQSD